MRYFYIYFLFILGFANCEFRTKRLIYDCEFNPEKKFCLRKFHTATHEILESYDIHKNLTSLTETDLKTRLGTSKSYYPVDGHSWFRRPLLKVVSSRLSENIEIITFYYQDGNIDFQDLDYSSVNEDIYVRRRVKYDGTSGMIKRDFVEDSSGNKLREYFKKEREGKKNLPEISRKNYSSEDYCKLPKRIEIICTFDFEKYKESSE
jgi:hypothetical protein